MIQSAETAHAVHYLFEWLALAVGAAVYRQRKRQAAVGTLLRGPQFSLLLGCLLGAAIGNKAMFWLENPSLIGNAPSPAALWLQGQSIVGGLLGGWLGVELAKWLSGWRGPRTGDDFVPAILSGIVIGRIGCFLAGLHDGTYGQPTTLPWGVNFGDGVPRHPTQLYESLLAAAALLSWPRWRRPLLHEPGLSFRAFMLGYLVWRVGVDALKPIPYAYALGLSAIQWSSLLVAVGLAVAMFGPPLKRIHR